MAAFSFDRDYLIAALIDLVRIDSVNPSLVPGGAGESRIAAHVAEQLERAGGRIVGFAFDLLGMQSWEVNDA